LVLGIKALILIFAVQAVITLHRTHSGWLNIWNRWDAVHYLALAEHGYVAEGEGRFSIVFFPLFPWLARAASFITSSYIGGVFLVSGIASLAAGLLFYRLVRLDEPEPVARNAVWFLFIFPTAYFLHVGYTESLFLALTLGCVFAARTERWWLAGLLGALASMTRVNGLLLGPVLFVEALQQFVLTRRINWRWLWMGLVPLGFLVYLAINYHVTGDPFTFSKIMEEHWFKKLAPPWSGLRELWSRLPGDVTEGPYEFFFIVVCFVCLVWSCISLRPSYALWVTLNWILIISTSFILSVPRYMLTLFPIFILFARATTNRPLPYALLTVFSLLCLGLYCSRFVQGLWAF
jgi:hypothetical protein